MHSNYIGVLHVFALSTAGMILTNSDGGADSFDVRAAVRMELSRAEVVATAFAAVASIITLFVFSTRESEYDQDEQRKVSIILWNIFLVCWLVAGVTLAVNAATAHESRIRRTRFADRYRDRSGDVSATTIVVLSESWSCIMMFLSFASYTAPQLARLAFPQFDFLRGSIAPFSNLCFLAHIMMLATCEQSSARMISVAHLSLHLCGAASDFLTDCRTHDINVGFVLRHVIGMSGVVFELALWLCVLKPMLQARNPELHDELPATVFRWLLKKGGLTVGMYCYFEAVGVGFNTAVSEEDISPWLTANSAIIVHFSFSAALAFTLLADANISLSAILRGLAPLRLKIGFAVSVCTSLIPLGMFAGREFSDGSQAVLYSAAYAIFMSLWAAIFLIASAGHSSQRGAQVDGTSEFELAHAASTRKPDDCKRQVSFSGVHSAVSGGDVVAAGI